MVKKIIMTAIAYNLTRFLINEALKKGNLRKYLTRESVLLGLSTRLRQWMSVSKVNTQSLNYID